MSGKKGLKPEAKKDLNAEILALKKKNEEEGAKEIQAVLEKRNLVITTQVPVIINGQELGVVLKSK